jgi:hypothetical protein
MSEVFREVALSWQGDEYHITPSLALLKRIKAKGIHTLNLAQACIQGGADPIDLAVAHKIFLAQAGVTVSEEDSYAFIVGGSQDVIDFQIAFVSAVLPSIDLGKKPTPRPTTGRGRTKKTKT